MENSLQTVEQAGGALQAGAAARERYEIQSMIMQAISRPRDEVEATARVRQSFSRLKMAEAAKYVFPRGKGKVSGASVDAAKEIARQWRNITFGFSDISEDPNYVHLRGWAHDLESNNKVCFEDKFEPKVQRKLGKGTPNERTEWVMPDERDLRELCNKRGSILIRNAIKAVVPAYIFEEALEVAEETIRREQYEREQFKSKIATLLHQFKKLEVTEAMISKFVGGDVWQMPREKYEELRPIWKSINDGETEKGEWFK